MGGSKYSKIAPKSEINRLKVGGAKPEPKDFLTREAVQYALDQTVNKDPKYQDADAKAVVNAAKKFLNANKLVTQTKITTTRAGLKGEPNSSNEEGRSTSFNVVAVNVDGVTRWLARGSNEDKKKK